MDYELVYRLGEAVWFFLDRLASIRWETWSDAKVISLALTIIAIAFAAVLLVWLWRRWIAAAVGLAGLAFAIIWLTSRPAPEPTYAPEARVAFHIPSWIWIILLVAVIFWLIWRLLGPEGRREIRLRQLRRLMEAPWFCRLAGNPTTEWRTTQAPTEQEAPPEKAVKEN